MKPFSKGNGNLANLNQSDSTDLNKSFNSIHRQTNQFFIPQQNLNDKAWFVKKWYLFDAKFFKPLLTNSSPTLIDTFPSILSPISRLLTTDEQLNNALNTTYSDTNIAQCGFNNVNFTGLPSDGDLVEHQERNSNYQRYSFENNSNFEENYLTFDLNDNRQQLNEILERSVGQLVIGQQNNDNGQQVLFDRSTLNQTHNNQTKSTKN